MSPNVRKAVATWLDAGNPSSLHEDGRRAKAAIDEAREKVSERLGCLFAECLFTSGGTESANLAILGAALANSGPHRTVLVGAAEHHAVLHTQAALHALGYRMELIPVHRDAAIDLEQLSAMLSHDVYLVSVMHANNELGTLNPVKTVSKMAHEAGALFHCDAVQTFGKVSSDESFVEAIGADLISVSAHKIQGPKGAGALYLRAGTKIKPWVAGGGQEREVRGGTENVAAIAGFGVAAQEAQPPDPAVRDLFLKHLIEAGFVSSVLPLTSVLAGHAHGRFPGIDAETMLIRLDREGISASSGAACSSGSMEPSHVLRACGYSHEESKEGLRFTFGPGNTTAEAESAAQRVIAVAQGVRARRV